MECSYLLCQQRDARDLILIKVFGERTREQMSVKFL
jgi:hypothetical protein